MALILSAKSVSDAPRGELDRLAGALRQADAADRGGLHRVVLLALLPLRLAALAGRSAGTAERTRGTAATTAPRRHHRDDRRHREPPRKPPPAGAPPPPGPPPPPGRKPPPPPPGRPPGPPGRPPGPPGTSAGTAATTRATGRDGRPPGGRASCRGSGAGGMLPGDGGRGTALTGVTGPRGAADAGRRDGGHPGPRAACAPPWPWRRPAAGGPGRGAAGRGGAPEPTPNGLLPTRGVRGPGLGACGRGGTVAAPASAAAGGPRRCWRAGATRTRRRDAGVAGRGRDGLCGRRCWAAAPALRGSPPPGAAGACGRPAPAADLRRRARARPGAPDRGRGPGRGRRRGRARRGPVRRAHGPDAAAGPHGRSAVASGRGAGAPDGPPACGRGPGGLAGGRGRPPGRGRPAPGRRAEPFSSPPATDSRSLRATGASTVEEGDFTYSPRSCNLLRTCLLLMPSSFASSCTRALPATALLVTRRPAAGPLDLEPSVEARSWCDLHDWLMTGRPCSLPRRARAFPRPRSRRSDAAAPTLRPAAPGRATPAGTPSAARHGQGIRDGVQPRTSSGEPTPRIRDQRPVHHDDPQQIVGRRPRAASDAGPDRSRTSGGCAQVVGRGRV